MNVVVRCGRAGDDDVQTNHFSSSESNVDYDEDDVQLDDEAGPYNERRRDVARLTTSTSDSRKHQPTESVSTASDTRRMTMKIIRFITVVVVGNLLTL